MGMKLLNSVGGVSVGLQPANVILSNADVISNNLTVNLTANLGNVSNVKILGGSANYILKTDGQGNLSWTSGDAIPGGSNTQVQFNDEGSLNGVSNFTYIKSNSLLSVNGNVTVGDNQNNVRLFSSGAISSTGNLSVANINTGGVLSVTGNANIGNVGATNGVFTNISGNLTSPSQPNITSIGNLSTLTVIGNANVGNLGTAGLITAIGNIQGGNLRTTGLLSVSGNANVGNLNTGFGFFSNDATVNGNLFVNGNLSYLNVETVAVEDPIIQLQTGPNGASPSSNSGKDIGTALNYYDTSAKVAFMGWDVSNAEIGLGSNVSVSNEVVAFTQYANVRAGNLLALGVFVKDISVTGNSVLGNITGNGSGLTNIPGANVVGQVPNALVAGTVYVNAQPNITSVGILTSLSVSGNANVGNLGTQGQAQIGGNLTVGAGSGGNISGANIISANTINTNILSGTGNANVGNIGATNGVFTNISGNGAGITNVTAITAQTVTNNSQPNITSVGVLTSLSISGNANVGNLGTAGLITASGNVQGGNLRTTGSLSVTGNANVGNIGATNGVFTNVSGNGSQLTGVVAVTAQTVTNNSQPNITSVGTLTSLSVSGNANVANIGANNGVFTNISGNGAGLTNIPGANVIGQVPNALVAGTVYTNAQPNITSVGTLTSLSVSGNANVGNLGTGLITASANIQGGNLRTTGLLSVGGNANIGNLGVTGVFATTLSATGNANVGNIGATNGVFTNITGNGAGITGVIAETAKTVTEAAQPNITSVGTLTSLSVSGNTTVDGNLLVNGNLTYLNVETVAIEDPIIQLQTGPNGAPPSSNSGKDVGTALNYYDTSAKVAFMGWQVSSKEMRFAANASIVNEVLTVNEYANVRINYLFAVGMSANVLTVSGDANLGNINTGRITATATVTAGNLSTAGILSVGGNANVGNLGTSGIITSSGNIQGSNLVATSNLQGGNVTTAGFLSVGGNANIGNIGTSGLLTATGNIQGGNLRTTGSLSATGNANVGNIGATNGVFTNITGNGAGITGVIAETAKTVTEAAQPNITSVGTLTSLSVSGNANVGNLNASNNILLGNGSGGTFSGANAVIANYFVSNSDFIALSGATSTALRIRANAVIIGVNAADTSPGANIVAIGTSAGQNSQGANAVSIGISAGADTQGANAVAIGRGAGTTSQSAGAVAIGSGAGGSSQGVNSIAVGTGAGAASQANNSIILNATGNTLNQTTANTFTVKPIRSASTGNVLYYDESSGEITYQPIGNITSIGTLSSLSVSGNANVGNIGAEKGVFTDISGNGAGLTNISGANVIGQVPNALVAGTVYTNSQPNITSLGTLTSLSVSGNLNAANLIGNHFGSGAGLSSIPGANVTGQVPNSLITGTVYTNAQPNITSLGTLTSLSVSGNINVTNINITGNYFGNGIGLTNIPGANVTGQVPNALVAGTVTTNAQPNITSVGTLTSLSVTGNLNAANLIGIHYGDGGNLTNLKISNQIANCNSNVVIPECNGNILIHHNGILIGTLAANIISLGPQAGLTSQGINTLAFGALAGSNTQGDYSVAIGDRSGQVAQGANSVAVGRLAGSTNQGILSVAMGVGAGQTTQGNNSVAIGFFAGNNTQGKESVAVGWEAGNIIQGNNAVAVGGQAGKSNQGAGAVAVGYLAGETTQGINGIAIGDRAGKTTQGQQAIALGDRAGEISQGINAVAIGLAAGRTNQSANSIVINATGANLENTVEGSFVVKPVRQTTSGNILYYNQSTGEISYETAANITTIGTLSSLSVTGNANIGNIGTGLLTTTGSTINGNLQFSGNARRITGLFSDTPFTNRVLFQTVTANRATTLGTIPSSNTSQQTTGYVAYSNTDPDTAAYAAFGINDGAFVVQGGTTGAGQTARPLLIYTNDAERMRIGATDGIGMFGTTDPNGSITNLQAFNAGIFRTFKGEVSAASNVATTLFTIPSETYGVWIVSVAINTGDVTNYSEVAMVVSQGNSVGVTILVPGANISITTAATRLIQATQTSGSTLTILYTATRIA
jgi:hypothetical protein